MDLFAPDAAAGALAQPSIDLLAPTVADDAQSRADGEDVIVVSRPATRRGRGVLPTTLVACVLAWECVAQLVWKTALSQDRLSGAAAVVFTTVYEAAGADAWRALAAARMTGVAHAVKTRCDKALARETAVEPFTLEWLATHMVGKRVTQADSRDLLKSRDASQGITADRTVHTIANNFVSHARAAAAWRAWDELGTCAIPRPTRGSKSGPVYDARPGSQQAGVRCEVCHASIGLRDGAWCDECTSDIDEAERGSVCAECCPDPLHTRFLCATHGGGRALLQPGAPPQSAQAGPCAAAECGRAGAAEADDVQPDTASNRSEGEDCESIASTACTQPRAATERVVRPPVGRADAQPAARTDAVATTNDQPATFMTSVSGGDRELLPLLDCVERTAAVASCGAPPTPSVQRENITNDCQPANIMTNTVSGGDNSLVRGSRRGRKG